MKSITVTCFCLSQQLLAAIRHVSSEFVFKTVPQHIGHAMFSDINTLQGSITTPLKLTINEEMDH